MLSNWLLRIERSLEDLRLLKDQNFPTHRQQWYLQGKNNYFEKHCVPPKNSRNPRNSPDNNDNFLLTEIYSRVILQGDNLRQWLNSESMHGPKTNILIGFLYKTFRRFAWLMRYFLRVMLYTFLCFERFLLELNYCISFWQKIHAVSLDNIIVIII